MTTMKQALPISTTIKIIRIVVIGLVIALAIGIISFVLSPSGQRYLANQTAAPAQADIDRVLVLADDALNHIFSPAVIQVEVGTTVTWEFADVDEDGVPVPHNVVFADEASPLLTKGEYARTFAELGIYNYVCTIHPFMERSVVVVDTK